MSRSRKELDREPGAAPTAAEDPAVFAPYPEIAEPGPSDRPRWKVIDSTGRNDLPSIGVTDPQRRVIYTPLRADGGAVSRHEMAHVMFSPPNGMPRVRFEPLVLHAVEDARVNLALAAAGLPLVFDFEYLADVRLRLARDLKGREIAVFLLRAVACLGSNALPIAREEMGAAPPRVATWAEGWIERIEARLEAARRRRGAGRGRAPAPFRVGRALARELAADLERHGLLERPLRAPELACCVAVPAEDGADSTRKRGRIDRILDRGRGRGRGDDGEPRPGRMQLRTVALPRARAGGSRPLGRRGRPSAEGCHLLRPHRHAIDRKVFRRPVRWRGGTVLIDVSGSMSLSIEGLDSLVDASGGAALVAIYSGREREGELRVVARGGRRAAPKDLEPFGSANVVDVPALEWLARQPEPRLWISDGGVTGEFDRSSREIRQRCARIVRQGRIERVDSADEAARRLAARGSRPSGAGASTPAGGEGAGAGSAAETSDGERRGAKGAPRDDLPF